MRRRTVQKNIAVVTGILFLVIMIYTPNTQAQETLPPLTNTIAPTATFTQAPTSTVTPSVNERLVKLEETVKKPRKDFWDIFQILSSFCTSLFTGVAIALLGIWATLKFNKQQLKSEEARAQRELNVSEIQTIQSFMHQLQSGDPQAIQAALLAIFSLGNQKLAARLAELYGNASNDPAVVNAVGRSILAMFGLPMQTIVQVARGGNVNGIGFFVRQDGYIITTHKAIDAEGEIKIISKTSELSASLVAQIPEDNLALLKVQGTDLPALSISKDIPVTIDTTVYLLGRDPQVGLVVSAGKVSGISRVDGYTRSELISADVMVPRAYGGAPVINSTGQVLGMVVLMWAEGRQASKIFILPVSQMRKFIEDNLGIK